MRKIWYFLVLWYLLVLPSCKPAQADDSQAEAAISAAQAPPTPVATALAQFKEVNYRISGSGQIKAGYEEVLLAETGGLLVRCPAANGRHARAGELLAAFDTSSLSLRRQKLEVQRYNARKEFESQLLGYENLLKGKSAKEAEEVRQKLRAATGLSMLDLDLQDLSRELAAATVRAPINGVLADVRIAAGMRIRPGQELLRIYSDQDLYLEVKVLESDLPLLRPGLNCTVQPLADSSKTYRATLREINPVVDPNGMVAIRLQIERPADLLLGMNATAEIRVPRQKGVVVPKEALVLRSARPVVFTLEDGLAKWNYVTPGLDNGREVEILEGIQAGATVITSNNLQLSHDAPVRPEK
ncbi:MAG: efflux RND transporter periplasmic adaptor subunit [Haliscomenobacter sp.]|nr:efflux RND transporter periplasmic adaptor subunit [Haliscomenobacter sp.]